MSDTTRQVALIDDVTDTLIESINYDADPPARPRRKLRCTTCDRTAEGVGVRICRACGGWMVYDGN